MNSVLVFLKFDELYSIQARNSEISFHLKVSLALSRKLQELGII